MLQRGGREFKPDWIVGVVPGFRLGSAAILTFALTMAMMTLAVAASDRLPVGGGIGFNIPPQPLGTALETYARMSGREVLYDGALSLGRRSSLVDGVYAPEVALQILLAGTGLWADFKDPEFFILGLASPEKPDQASTGRRSTEQVRYYARLQASLKTAFCGNGVLPDGNRVAARLWIGQWGDVLQVERLGSTGRSELDQQVEKALHGLRLDGPPPAGFAQPVTIVIMPSDAALDCDNARRLPVRAGP